MGEDDAEQREIHGLFDPETGKIVIQEDDAGSE